MLRNLQSAVALLTCGCMAGYASVPIGIGILVTDRPALVDGISIRGNATLFSGNVVQAASASSSLRFADGSSLVLQPGAQVRVFRDSSVLEQGVATQTGSTRRELIVDGLAIIALSEHGAVAAAWRDGSHFQAVADNGPAEVRTPVGKLVARLNPGESRNFTISAASSALQAQEKEAPPSGPPITVRGIVRQDADGEFRITNDADGAEYLLGGSFPLSSIGASVEIRGIVIKTSTSLMCDTPSATGGRAACQRILAHSTRVLAAGSTPAGSTKAEGQPPNQPNPPTPTAEGTHWHSGTVILIAAVAGGGALVALLTLSMGKGSSTSTSAP